MRSTALQWHLLPRESLLVEGSWFSTTTMNQPPITWLMSKLPYSCSTTQFSTLSSLLIQSVLRFGMLLQELCKVFSETWLKKKSPVFAWMREKENCSSETQEEECSLSISKMALKWRNSKKEKNQRTKIKMIFQACFIGVIKQFSSLLLGMVTLDRMMIAIVWRREPLNIKWTSIKMQSTF